MAHWRCVKGNTLLCPSGPNNGQKHLFALLLDPVVVEGMGPRKQVLMVGITSIHDGVPYDNTCVLKAGEHPLVTHDSYVNFGWARLDEEHHVMACIEDETFNPHHACSDALIKKLIGGALRSNRLRTEYRQILEKVLFPSAYSGERDR